MGSGFEPGLDVGRALIHLPCQSTTVVTGEVELFERLARVGQDGWKDCGLGRSRTGPVGRGKNVDGDVNERRFLGI